MYGVLSENCERHKHVNHKHIVAMDGRMRLLHVIVRARLRSAATDARNCTCLVVLHMKAYHGGYRWSAMYQKPFSRCWILLDTIQFETSNELHTFITDAKNATLQLTTRFNVIFLQLWILFLHFYVLLRFCIRVEGFYLLRRQCVSYI